MAQQLADRRDIDFVLWEQLNCEQFLDHELYQDFNKKTCEMILTEARSLAKGNSSNPGGRRPGSRSI
jgi:hypothetical protein